MKLTTRQGTRRLKSRLSRTIVDLRRHGAVAVLAALGLASAAHATTPPRPVTTDAANAFAAGYVLEYSHLKAFEFVDAVKQLRDVDDDAKAGKMVQDLNVQGEAVRKLEADTYTQASALLKALNAPAKTIDWLDKTAGGLREPADKKAPTGVISDELAVEKLTAIVDETGRVQGKLIDNLALLGPALRSRSVDTLWAFDAGTYDAKVTLWSGSAADIPMLRKEATHLVARETLSTPVDVQSALQAVIPSGVPDLTKSHGNLSSIMPNGNLDQAALALHALPDVLNARYGATALAAAMVDKAGT